MFEKNFEIGQLVWAKMKRFPYWPARVEPPPDTKSASPKKQQHYVYFFGSENYAWILDKYIVPHSEHMVNSCGKKKSAILQTAIDEIVKVALEENSKPKVKTETPSVVKCEPPALEIKKEKRVRKVKSTSERTLKRRHSSDRKTKDNHLSSTPKVPKISDDLSTVLSVHHNVTASGSRVAVIRPYDDAFANPYDIAAISRTLMRKHVKPTNKKIGFLGLGMMGRGIVKNLLNSGHHVTLWNRTPEKCEDFIKAGAIKGLTPADVVKNTDIIFSCVSDLEAVRDVIFGSDGVLQGLEKSTKGEKGYVEMSSIDVETSQEIAEAVSIKGGKYLEAPITGNRKLAHEGLLIILGSGDRSLFDNCETCFHAMSKHAYFVSSEVGKSTKYNLIISTLAGTICGALAETLALAERVSVSRGILLDLLKINGFGSKLIADKGKAICERSFSTSTPLKHQQKDVNLTLCMSHGVQQPMPVTASANELYKHAKLLGYSEHDMAAVYQGAKY